MAKSEIHKKYVELLQAILYNAENFKIAGSELLLTGQKKKREAIWNLSQFMFYSCVEECGKFLLTLDTYPDNLSEKMLKKIGFNNHDEKIDRVIMNWSISSRNIDINILKNREQMRDLFRTTLREQSLYVDFKNGKIEIPAPRSITNKDLLDKLVKIVVNILSFCEMRLGDFESNPVEFLKHPLS